MPTDKRLVIYTVLTGAKEALGDPLAELEPGGEQTDLQIDWICFTDDPQASSPRWQMRLLDEPLPPERSSRRPKCLPHEYLGDWQHSLYIDNIVRFRRLPSSAELGLGSSLRAFRHATRKDPLAEAEAIVLFGYESVDSLAGQLDFYRERGLTEGIEQLSTCTLLLRAHHEPAIRRLSQLWWEQFLLFGKRDQMSFDVALRLSGAAMDYWPGQKNECDWLRNVPNISSGRVLANFDAARYRWRYRHDPQALADPRRHYRAVGAHDGRNHARPVELLSWLAYRHHSSLGRHAAPRRGIAEQLEAWLLPRRQAGARMLYIAVRGGGGAVAYADDELDAASLLFATYMAPHGGMRLDIGDAELSAGKSRVEETGFDLVIVLGAAAAQLPAVLKMVAPSLVPAAGQLLLGLRTPAEAPVIASAQAQLAQALGPGHLVQSAVQSSHHDELDAPLRNSLIALAWAQPSDEPPMPSTTTKKRYIAYCTSGLGNRLRPLASAIAYCQASGRELLVYWDDVTPNGCLTPWSDLFTTPIKQISLDEIAALDPLSTALFTEKGPGHGVEREATRHQRPQLLQLAQAGARLGASQALRLDEAADTVIVYDNNYLQNLPRQASIDALRQLNPHPRIRARVMATAAGLGLKPGTPAVHARGTDFNMKEALATYCALIDERIPSGDFFLSTEDEQLEAGLRERYGQRLKSRPDRLHLQLKEGKTSWSEPDSYTITREHGVDALVDLYLLSSVSLAVYHPGSTFAEIARHLHGLLQGLDAPQEAWPEDKAAALVQAKARFKSRLLQMLPRGVSQPLDIDEGAAGPVPPERLPPSYLFWETLGYRLPLMERLFMSSHSGQPELHWDGALFNQLAQLPELPLDLFRRLCPYPEAWSQMQLMRGYIAGKRVLVIGSETFWIELLCARAGAAGVHTVEYRPIHWSEAPRAPLQTSSWDAFTGDLGAHAGRYDLVLSYSSIEHSGLGRYGDRLTPLGDLFTFQLMAQCLKPGGLCAVAVPTGQDLTHFNAHRIYGEQRIRALEQVSDLRYQGIVYPDADYLAQDPDESLRHGWSLQALARLPLGQYRQPILCFARDGFSVDAYRAG